MIIDWLEEWFKGVLIDGIIGNLSGLFDTVNTKVGEIAADVGATPQGWNSGIFNMIRNLSESVIIPIAGAILAFVMTYELIQMVTEKNNLHEYEALKAEGIKVAQGISKFNVDFLNSLVTETQAALKAAETAVEEAQQSLEH